VAGRHALKPTDEERKQVEAMAGYGVPFEMIASLVRGGIDADTLNKHFKQELRQGKAKACAKVGQSLFQKATSGDDTAAAIWWTKTQMGWKDTSRVEMELSGKVTLGGIRPDDQEWQPS
jgi:hypothetical protein